uniref:Uncharacterized protein n=1 Tax=Anopheles farauti TaxID=69004 RepID=A0A182Q2B9_9DIPT
MLMISCSRAAVVPKLFHSIGARSGTDSRFLLSSSSAVSRDSGFDSSLIHWNTFSFDGARACGLLGGGLDQPIGGHRLGTLDRQSEGTVPHERGQHAEGTGHTEQHGVVVHLLQAVVLEQHARVGVYVRPRVLHLAELGQDWRHDLVDVRDQPEQRIVRQMLEGELALAGVARIGLAQHGVPVARHDLARLERLPDELLHLVLARVVAELLAELLQPHQHLLVGEPVQRTGETVHAGRERQVRVAQGRPDQMDRVRRHVATLVVAVDRQVQAHQLRELLVLVAEHLGEVGRPVLLRVDRPDTLAVAMVAAITGSFAIRSMLSSYTYSQYLLLCTPSAYALANLLSWLSAVTAQLSCDIGCSVVGMLFSIVTTCDGSAARLAHSRDSASTCAFDGTSPVISNQNRPSGSGSWPPCELVVETLTLSSNTVQCSMTKQTVWASAPCPCERIIIIEAKVCAVGGIADEGGDRRQCVL